MWEFILPHSVYKCLQAQYAKLTTLNTSSMFEVEKVEEKNWIAEIRMYGALERKQKSEEDYSLYL